MIPGSFNFRDLGGLPVAEGVIATGQVYRSDLLHRTDVDEARAVLRSLDVGLVIDLRTGGERVDDGAFPDDGPIAVVHVPVLADVWSWDDERAEVGEHFLRDRTIEMFDARGDQLVTVLRAITTSSGPVVFHCTAGKDRTGATAAAMLGVLGAGRQVIMDDYARSADAMPGIVEWYRAQAAEHHVIGAGDEKDHRAILERATMPATMGGLYDHIVERYGSFRGWAHHFEMHEDEIAAFRDRVVTD